MASYMDRLSATIFHDASPKDFLPFYYKIMNYQEGPYDELHTSGLSADYVARETKRAIAGVDGKVKIYPGYRRADQANGQKNDAGHVRKAVRAAFDAGADGAVLSREYVEMWLANLSAAGETLREIFNKRPA